MSAEDWEREYAQPTITRLIWKPQTGPRSALVKCPLPEIFFGGSRGGGKTDSVLGCLRHERRSIDR